MNYNGLQIGIQKSKKRFSNTTHHAFPGSAVDFFQHKLRKTTKLCSCRGCGNQRKWEGPTIQEVKWHDCADQQILDLTNAA